MNRVRASGQYPPASTDWEEEGVPFTLTQGKRDKPAGKSKKAEQSSPTWMTQEDKQREEIGRQIQEARELRQQGAKEDEQEEELMGEDTVRRRQRAAQLPRQSLSPEEVSENSSDNSSEYSSADEEPQQDQGILGPWLQLAGGVFGGPQTRSRGPAPEQPLVPSRCLAWQQTRKPRKNQASDQQTD